MKDFLVCYGEQAYGSESERSEHISMSENIPTPDPCVKGIKLLCSLQFS